MKHRLRAFWPDGSTELIEFIEVVGLVKQINGERVRPLALLYDGNVNRIESVVERERLIETLRYYGAYWKS